MPTISMQKMKMSLLCPYLGCNIKFQNVSTLSIEMQMCAIHDFSHAQVRASYD
jgi:hypothetical protein